MNYQDSIKEKISFIVIGRNESEKLARCFKSIHSSLDINNLTDYEIIYVDSNSSDSSIEIAKKFKNIRIFKITGAYNASIARNIGAKESLGGTLFFIDGDMEIQPDFLANIYDRNIGLKYDFVSGDILNVYNDLNGNTLKKERYFNNEKTLIQQEVGGIFLIKRENWFSAGGMKNIFKRSQDIDFALRLAKKNLFLKRLPVIAASHHTINYRDYKRKWKMIFDKSELYSRSLLYRTNILNIYTYKRILFHDYSMITLFITTLIFLLFNISPLIFLAYLGVIVYRSLKNMGFILDNLLYYLVRDIHIIMGFLLFFPKKPVNINYVTIQ